MAFGLKRYWFEFEFPKPRIGHGVYIPANGCCGITAFDYDDALNIMRRFMLRENETPIFRRVIENVDMTTIEDENVFCNLGVPIWRGVWYPDTNLRQGAYIEK
jgi:hypothetical protein